jgi:hypothetical protein
MLLWVSISGFFYDVCNYFKLLRFFSLWFEILRRRLSFVDLIKFCLILIILSPWISVRIRLLGLFSVYFEGSLFFLNVNDPFFRFLDWNFGLRRTLALVQKAVGLSGNLILSNLLLATAIVLKFSLNYDFLFYYLRGRGSALKTISLFYQRTSVLTLLFFFFIQLFLVLNWAMCSEGVQRFVLLVRKTIFVLLISIPLNL